MGIGGEDEAVLGRVGVGEDAPRHQRLDGAIIAPPSSFEIDGKQYIAVATGWGVDGGRFQGFLDQAWGVKTQVPLGGTVYVFAVD